MIEVTVITNVSEAVAVPSLTVQVIAYVLPPSASPVKSDAAAVPPNVALPPVSAVSDMKPGISVPVSTQV